MWGNDVHGDCVTAEEAFAKACYQSEIFISDQDVITWATQHGVLEGAYLYQVLGWMRNDGFSQDGQKYDDGSYFSVDWTQSGMLTSAISQGPVKIGIAADQLSNVWSQHQGRSGWFATGFTADANEDHCVSLCGYGTIAWLAQQLNVSVPSGVDGTKPGYAMFTWNSIGIIDVPSMLAITHEAWLRNPTTVIQTPGQTDVSLVDENGQLNVFWVDGAGAWQGPEKIGPAGFANPGSAVTASQQFGINNQTDVFLVDKTGQLNVFWVDGAGAWQGPEKIGPAGFANSGSAVTASQQFGINNQTDVFLVDKTGQLNVFWVDGAGVWQGPEKIGPAGFANPGSAVTASQQFGINNQTDVFLVDKTGQLNVFWVDGAGAWQGPEKIGPAGFANPGSAVTASQQFGINNQTDVFLVDKTGQLNVFWVDGAGVWQGPEKIGPAGFANPGSAVTASQQFGINNQTDVFLVDKTGQLNVFWVDGAGAWQGPEKIGPAGFANSGSAVTASQQFGINNQTDVFLVDKTGQLNVFWVDGAGAWQGPEKIGPAGFANPGSTITASQQFINVAANT